MQLKNASISFLVSQDGTELRIRDNEAALDFVRVRITPEQLSKMLSRLSDTPCTAEVFSLDNVGKKHECETFEFEIPKELRSSSHAKALCEIAIAELEKSDKSDWEPDEYFSSQNSFFSRDGKEFARVIIRRWI